LHEEGSAVVGSNIDFTQAFSKGVNIGKAQGEHGAAAGDSEGGID
jgi:hypothetical protein